MSCRLVTVEGVGTCRVQVPDGAVWTDKHEAAFADLIRAAQALQTARPDAHPDALGYLAARLHMDRLLA